MWWIANLGVDRFHSNGVVVFSFCLSPNYVLHRTATKQWQQIIFHIQLKVHVVAIVISSYSISAELMDFFLWIFSPYAVNHQPEMDVERWWFSFIHNRDIDMFYIFILLFHRFLHHLFPSKRCFNNWTELYSYASKSMRISPLMAREIVCLSLLRQAIQVEA